MFTSVIKRGFSTASVAARNIPWNKFELEMWNAYKMVAPQASKIQYLFKQKGENIINDHVAFRTYNHKKIDINVFEENLLKYYNYKPIHKYNIPEKNLTAKLSLF